MQASWRIGREVLGKFVDRQVPSEVLGHVRGEERRRDVVGKRRIPRERVDR